MFYVWLVISFLSGAWLMYLTIATIFRIAEKRTVRARNQNKPWRVGQ